MNDLDPGSDSKLQITNPKQISNPNSKMTEMNLISGFSIRHQPSAICNLT